MYKYKAFGMNIHSEIFFPELTVNESDVHDLTISLDKLDVFSEKSILEGEYFKVTENSIFRFWEDIGKFKISRGNEIIVEPAQDVNEAVLRSFILGTVMASLLHQRGLFVLHSSAVNINGKVVGFLGHKGYGKSTTAMTFYRKGYPIIADDYIALDPQNSVPLVYPGFPSLRLSYKSRDYGNFSLKRVQYNGYEIDKIHVPAQANFSLNQLPLKKLYVLKRGDCLKITDIKGQEALMKLVENTFGIVRFKESDFAENLKQCASILNHVNVSHLEVPDSLREVQGIVELVIKDINKENKE
ncbi:MAG: hypothetical protein ACPK7O_05160 [Methanobacterium sp.]